MIRILIADDHRLFRDGLARILNDAPEMTVVASVGSGEEALQRAADLKPDVVLMDVHMPGLGGLEATRHLRARHPEIKIIMLTISERPAPAAPCAPTAARRARSPWRRFGSRKFWRMADGWHGISQAAIRHTQ